MYLEVRQRRRPSRARRSPRRSGSRGSSRRSTWTSSSIAGSRSPRTPGLRVGAGVVRVAARSSTSRPTGRSTSRSRSATTTSWVRSWCRRSNRSDPASARTWPRSGSRAGTARTSGGPSANAATSRPPARNAPCPWRPRSCRRAATSRTPTEEPSACGAARSTRWRSRAGTSVCGLNHELVQGIVWAWATTLDVLARATGRVLRAAPPARRALTSPALQERKEPQSPRSRPCQDGRRCAHDRVIVAAVLAAGACSSDTAASTEFRRGLGDTLGSRAARIPSGCPVDDDAFCATASEVAAALSSREAETLFALSRSGTIDCAEVAREYFPACASDDILQGYGSAARTSRSDAGRGVPPAARGVSPAPSTRRIRTSSAAEPAELGRRDVRLQDIPGRARSTCRGPPRRPRRVRRPSGCSAASSSRSTTRSGGSPCGTWTRSRSGRTSSPTRSRMRSARPGFTPGRRESVLDTRSSGYVRCATKPTRWRTTAA